MILKLLVRPIPIIVGWYIGERISYKIFGSTAGDWINEKFVKK